jgi:cell division inhibitor SepF
MGVRDSLDRFAAWFGFGPDEDEYEERRSSAKEAPANGDGDAASGPPVRRLNRGAERSSCSSSAFGTSLGDLFGSESANRERGENSGGGPAHLRPVPDQSSPARVSVVEPANFNDAQPLADRFKRQQPVILNLQNVDGELSRRMVDFCSGLTYALDGQIQTVANRVFLLTPRNVEVSAEERKRLAERAFFNQL